MTADIAFRVVIGLGAVLTASWPFVRPQIDALIARASSKKPAAETAAAPGDADAHTVMSIAIRLKEAGKTKSAEIARSLVDSMLTE
jgi:hypothetical protein